MDYYRAFPFYMGYQGFGQWNQSGEIVEDKILEDLEYLQQMYPYYAKRYQGVILSVVDKMDYDGSFIYDQYPDKLTMQRVVSSVLAIIKANEENSVQQEAVQASESVPWQEKEPWIRELVTVILFYEILRRRRMKKKTYII